LTATTTQGSFASRLRMARERAGVTLETIAESTKIKRSFLVGLENGDLSHWPSGIFRRAFFRDYVTAIGIGSDSLVEEFVRLFPENGASPPAASATDESGELRLTLADARESRFARVMTHLPVALADLTVVAFLVAAVGALFDVQGWAAAAVIALAYYSAGTAYAGRTPCSLLVSSRTSFRRAAPVQAAAVRALRIVSRQPALSRKVRAGEAATEETLRPQPRFGSRRRLRAESRMVR
jgi:transcriptional regulator with XRE-family HTH domain